MIEKRVFTRGVLPIAPLNPVTDVCVANLLQPDITTRRLGSITLLKANERKVTRTGISEILLPLLWRDYFIANLFFYDLHSSQ